MGASNSMDKLLSVLTKDMTDEEVTMSFLQAMIASEITGYRIKHHMTQKDLAQLLGVTQSMLSKWESGETNFQLSTLVTIGCKLGLDMQPPFVPSPPKPYIAKHTNMVCLSNPNAWQAYTYAPDPPANSITESEIELQEM